MAYERKPNVMIFMLDTQRADRLGCYGYSKPTSPHLDRLAGEGAVFLDNISPAIWTLPAVASMFSGMHVVSHGACAAYEGFLDSPATLAQALSRCGYATAGFFCNDYAWESRKGFREAHLPQPSGSPSYNFEGSRARVNQVLRWIDAHSQSNSQTPFFVYIQVMDPHFPHRPNREFRERFVPADSTEAEEKKLNDAVFPVYLGRYRFCDRDRALLNALYDADTAQADSHLGVLADALRARGMLDDTIFIVMGDHGEMLGEHRDSLGGHDHFAHHLCVYEELIKVPLVVRYPPVFRPGIRVTAPTQTLDIAPTLAEIVGFEFPQAQGFSLVGAAQGSPQRDYALSEYQKSVHWAWRALSREPEADPRVYLPAIKAWRKNGMKYIWRSDLRDELYDLNRDPKEQNNLIGEQADTAKAMRLELERFCAGLPVAKTGDLIAAGKPCPPEISARLRGMGWYHEI